MVDKQTRQIEHAGHQGDDRDNMKRLDPHIHRETHHPSANGPALRRERSAPAEHCLMERRHIRKRVSSKTIILESKGLSLSECGFDSRNDAPPFSAVAHIPQQIQCGFYRIE